MVNNNGIPKFLNTKNKKSLVLSFILYPLILSTVAGTPIPFPSVFSPSQEQIALLNFSSLLITLVGSIIGVGFYLEKRQNNKIERIEERIDESVLALKAELKELHNEMKDMEKRICDSVAAKIANMEQHTDLKVSKAKELADQKIEHMEDSQRDMRKDIQNMERGYHNSNRYSRRNEEREDNNNRGEENGV